MDPTTVLSTFLNVKAMVTDILKAREELTKMPDKTKSLLNLVDCEDKSLEKLRPAASALGGSEAEAGMIQSPDQDNKNELLRPFLDSLGEELLRAHGKLEKFQRKSDDVAARNKVWETGKAYFGLAAARQNKRTTEICDSIRSLLYNLNLAILVEDHGILVSVNQIVSRGIISLPVASLVHRFMISSRSFTIWRWAVSTTRPAAWMWRSLPATTVSSGPLAQRRGKVQWRADQKKIGEAHERVAMKYATWTLLS